MPVSLRIDRLETPSIEAAPLVPRCRCCRRLLLPDRPSSLLLSRIHTGILFLLTAWWYDSICIHHPVELPWFFHVWVFTMRRIGNETWIDIPGMRINHTQLDMAYWQNKSAWTQDQSSRHNCTGVCRFDLIRTCWVFGGASLHSNCFTFWFLRRSSTLLPSLIRFEFSALCWLFPCNYYRLVLIILLGMN